MNEMIPCWTCGENISCREECDKLKKWKDKMEGRNNE